MDIGSLTSGLLTGLREGVEAALIVSMRVPAKATAPSPGASSPA